MRTFNRFLFVLIIIAVEATLNGICFASDPYSKPVWNLDDSRQPAVNNPVKGGKSVYLKAETFIK